MVEEMQALNKKLEETVSIQLKHFLSVFNSKFWVRSGCDLRLLKQEAAIEEYFKPIDKQAEMIMKTQLEGEEKTMKEMMKAMQQQALLEKEEIEKLNKVNQAGELGQPKQSFDEGKAANSWTGNERHQPSPMRWWHVGKYNKNWYQQTKFVMCFIMQFFGLEICHEIEF